MYYWVIVLFSMVTILTYKLADRNDKFDVSVAPQMEAAAAGIVKQHEAALAYVEAESYTYTMSEEYLDPDLYTKYGAYGRLQAQQGSSDRFKTVILCIDATQTDKVGECGYSTSMNFLITYGDIPSKWDSDALVPYFLTILGRYTSRSSEVGMLESTSSDADDSESSVRGADYVIDSVKGSVTYLPDMFSCIATPKEGQLMYITQLTKTSDGSYIESAGSCDAVLSNASLAPGEEETE